MTRYSLDKSKIKVLLLEGVDPSAVELFHQAGYSQVEYLKGALDDAELQEKIRDVHFLGIRSRTHLTEAVLSRAEKLVAIGCFCIGTNQVDLGAAETRGIPVFNAPYSNTRSVAELVTGEYLLLLRGIPAKNAKAHRGEWDKSAANSVEARGKTLGIVGYGHIGTQVGIIAESLGMQVCYYDIENKLSLGNARQVSSLQELLAKADVVSMHVPETPETRDMMGAEQFTAMKSGAIFLNASRGTLVDEEALLEALQSGHLAGAASDVARREPPQAGDPLLRALELPNFILTPHVAWASDEAMQTLANQVIANLEAFQRSESLRRVV